MQGQSYVDVPAASIPSNFYGHDSMPFDQYRQGHGSDGPVQSWQTLAQQNLNQAEAVATEQKMKPRETKKIDPKIEKSNKSPEIKQHSLEVLTPSTNSSNDRKRNYEEARESGRVEKKANVSQKKPEERKNAPAKCEDRSIPKTPNSDLRRKDQSTPSCAKWISDGRGGFKSVECSPDGTSSQSASSGGFYPLDFSSPKSLKAENNDHNDELVVLVKERHHPDDEILFKVRVFSE